MFAFTYKENVGTSLPTWMFLQMNDHMFFCQLNKIPKVIYKAIETNIQISYENDQAQYQFKKNSRYVTERT